MSLENKQLDYLQDLHEDFDHFLGEKNWEQCRAVLKAIEEFRVDTSELRREMNVSMASRFHPKDNPLNGVKVLGV